MNIEIINIKNISKLVFDVPKSGAYLLTGANGVGKSTLLGCLDRIGNSNAFPFHFRTHEITKTIDTFSKGEIKYTINGKTISFRKNGSRWSSTPRTNSDWLLSFGFDKVAYIGANSKRIEPSANELKGNNKIKNADKNLIKTLNDLLGTTKFDNLKFINAKQGKNTEAFLIQVEDEYFSEKNFSLGEISIMYLVRTIQKLPKKSLIIIDEVEMGLHPKVQLKLWEYLVKSCKDKDNTVIMSSHSASLIKTAKKDNIIHLEDTGNGEINIIHPCYSARVLGNIAIDADFVPDFILLVEDSKAKIYLDLIVKRYLKSRQLESHPIYRILPIGGWDAVIRFINETDKYLFSDNVKVFAFPDKDASQAINNIRKRDPSSAIIKIYDKYKSLITCLPITPEEGLIEYLEADVTAVSKAIMKLPDFSNYQIDIAQIIMGDNYKKHSGNNNRTNAKYKLKDIVSYIMNKSNLTEDNVEKQLFSYFVEKSSTDALNSFIAPILNKK